MPITPETAQALGLLTVKAPQVAAMFLNELDRRKKAEAVSRVFKQVGINTKDPNIMAVHGMLAAGAIDPENAMKMILQLRNQAINELVAQSQYLDIQLRLLQQKQQQVQFEKQYNLEQQKFGLEQQKFGLEQEKLRQTEIENAYSRLLSPFTDGMSRLNELEKNLLQFGEGAVAFGQGGMKKIDTAGVRAKLAGVRTLKGLLEAIRNRVALKAQELQAQGKNPAVFGHKLVSEAIAEVTAKFGEANYAAVAQLIDPEDLKKARDTGDAFVAAAQVVPGIEGFDFGDYLKNLFQSTLKYTVGDNKVAYVPPELRGTLFKGLEAKESEWDRRKEKLMQGVQNIENAIPIGQAAGATLLGLYAMIKRGKVFQFIKDRVRKEMPEAKPVAQEVEKLAPEYPNVEAEPIARAMQTLSKKPQASVEGAIEGVTKTAKGRSKALLNLGDYRVVKRKDGFHYQVKKGKKWETEDIFNTGDDAIRAVIADAPKTEVKLNKAESDLVSRLPYTENVDKKAVEQAVIEEKLKIPEPMAKELEKLRKQEKQAIKKNDIKKLEQIREKKKDLFRTSLLSLGLGFVPVVGGALSFLFDTEEAQ